MSKFHDRFKSSTFNHKKKIKMFYSCTRLNLQCCHTCAQNQNWRRCHTFLTFSICPYISFFNQCLVVLFGHYLQCLTISLAPILFAPQSGQKYIRFWKYLRKFIFYNSSFWFNFFKWNWHWNFHRKFIYSPFLIQHIKIICCN